MYKIIFAGFGGQGIQTMSKFLAYSAMDNNLNVSWLPSYGPEMRGGTSNCSVILGKDEVASPIITHADAVIVMNNPSLEKFQSYLKKDGFLIIDSNLVTINTNRNDVKIIKVPCDDIATSIGNKSLANMILLGSLINLTNLVPLDSLINSIKLHGKPKYYDLNKLALNTGYTFINDNINICC